MGVAGGRKIAGGLSGTSWEKFVELVSSLIGNGNFAVIRHIEDLVC